MARFNVMPSFVGPDCRAAKDLPSGGCFLQSAIRRLEVLRVAEDELRGRTAPKLGVRPPRANLPSSGHRE